MADCSTCPSGSTCTKDKETCGIVNNPLNHIKNVIGIMSGKGGVGKSTVTAMLAKDLARRGFKVGIMDADITGPSIPRLMGLQGQMATGDGKNIIPVVTKEGIKVISLNLLLEDESQAVVWRGSLISSAVKQFWEDVLWGELDFLLIDMPPGTGDVALTVMQSTPVNGVVMVSVPQDMVSMIVAKAVNMTKKLNVPVIGIVENMSYIMCPGCNTKISFHEESGAYQYLKDMDLNLLGELPMTKGIAKLTRGEDSIDSEKMFAPIAANILKEIEKL
ncbi:MULTISPECIES: Mrp/NBP35 family ATP-binding protein [Fusobacterium]|jgi:Mrp family chromosome partitioning ATPase|uniref:Iron-sulfur cluster carrier protein n=1 Tax=Fusobacterium hominis TaxID=2764326 RepID=A0A7G9GUL8_9FUSO|nr:MULTISPECIES: Mrp/NBP35 family ATP-binding protein [Fusobacterium]QNM14500.1 Mrp/NBP35 family ATP-binding protein [Fusobacterium hominis]